MIAVVLRAIVQQRGLLNLTNVYLMYRKRIVGSDP